MVTGDEDHLRAALDYVAPDTWTESGQTPVLLESV